MAEGEQGHCDQQTTTPKCALCLQQRSHLLWTNTSPKVPPPESLLQVRPVHLCLPLLKSFRECSSLGDPGTLSLWWGAVLAGDHPGVSPRAAGALGSPAAEPGCAGQPLLLQGVQQFCLSSQMILNNVSPAPCVSWEGAASDLF